MLTIFGAIAVSFMMIFYALEQRSTWFTFASACSCLAPSRYAWLAGTWPFAVVELVWASIAFRKWWTSRQT